MSKATERKAKAKKDKKVRVVKDELAGQELVAEAGVNETTKSAESEQRLAQIVNLFIAGHSLTSIGEAIGATADEVDRMLQNDATRYVRNQPQLRTYVRNWVSHKYTQLLESDWEAATEKVGTYTDADGIVHSSDPSNKLAHQDRVIRILDGMRKLHGADAPVQAEIKVEHAPEAVEKMVSRLAASAGLGYDTSIFDAEVIDGEVIDESTVQESAELLEIASQNVETENEGEEL